MAAGYFLYFAFYGLLVPYLSPTLLDLGFSRREIGFVTAGLYLIATIMPVLSGRVSDRYLSADRVVRICALGLALTTAALWWQAEKTALFLVVLFVLGIFRGPMIPMLDTTAMSVVDGDARRYARLRMFGSIGFAVAAVAMGFLVDGFGQGVFFPFVTAICLGLSVAVIGWLPREIKVRPTEEGGVAGRGFWHTLSRSWWIWVAALACHWLAFAPYHYGYTLFMQEAAMPDALSGVVWALAVVTETGFFFISGWFFNRYSFQAILMLAFVTNLVRWSVLVIYPEPWLIVATQLLHGPGFALFYTAMIAGITHYCGGVRRASYQGVVTTSVNGFASILGTALAGSLHEHMPFREMLMWFLPVQILGIVLLASSRLKPHVVSGGPQET